MKHRHVFFVVGEAATGNGPHFAPVTFFFRKVWQYYLLLLTLHHALGSAPARLRQAANACTLAVRHSMKTYEYQLITPTEMNRQSANNLLSLLFLAATLGVALYATFNNDTIIIHWGTLHVQTVSGMSYLILFLPLLSAALYALLRKAISDPFGIQQNVETPKTEQNAQFLRQYFSVLSPCITGLLLYVTLCAAGFLTLVPLIVVLLVAFLAFFYVTLRRRLTNG